MDSEEVEKWDEESERAWKNDNLDVHFPETIVSTLKLILPAKAKILDAGCGVGKHVRAFRRLGYEVTGIDQSKKAIEYAKILNPDSILLNIRLQQLDALNCYDLIHTCAVLQHSKHERKIEILQRFHKALKPNGYLLCAECTFTLETLKQLKEKNPSVGLSEDWTDGYSFSEKGWRRFMAANNFLHVKTIPPWPYYLFQKM
jgi:2-polyprenyl-3-methyl-5-hydroxy-6-metoxy-1,4-benzoquinol methylase